MFSILLILLIIVAVLMIGLILLQKSEGSGMSGSSASAMLGGALTGVAAGNFLTRMTAWLATIFFVLCALLALVSSKSSIVSQKSELRQELVLPEEVAAQETARQETIDAVEKLKSGDLNTNAPIETVPLN